MHAVVEICDCIVNIPVTVSRAGPDAFDPGIYTHLDEDHVEAVGHGLLVILPVVDLRP